MINGKNIDKLVELDQRAKRKRRVSGAERHAADPDAPVIRIVGGELPRIVDEAEAALLGLSGRNIYQRGGTLVRLAMVEIETADGGKATGRRLVEANATYLVEQLTRRRGSRGSIGGSAIGSLPIARKKSRRLIWRASASGAFRRCSASCMRRHCAATAPSWRTRASTAPHGFSTIPATRSLRQCLSTRRETTRGPRWTFFSS